MTTSSNRRLKVCILAAGRGARMESLFPGLHKALVPYHQQALISHLIGRIPDGLEIVVAVHHLEEQLRSYLEVAHPERSFTYVHVDKIEGRGAGPGYSLLACRRELPGPFVFMTADTLWDDATVWSDAHSWLAVGKSPPEESAAYCNLRVKDSRIMEIRDKQPVPKEDAGSFGAFVGMGRIEDSKQFLEALQTGQTGSLTQGELQLSHGFAGMVSRGELRAKWMSWKDLGTPQKYFAELPEAEKNYFKTGEIFYRVGNRVIKYFSDPDVLRRRAARAALFPKTFVQVGGCREPFFWYSYVEGGTFYEEAGEGDFSRLLTWLMSDLWRLESQASDRPEFEARCLAFYREKTLARLEVFQKSNPEYREPVELSGRRVPLTADLLGAVPWAELAAGIERPIHGDLQLGNILVEKTSRKFRLIDWRQDFQGSPLLGDWYYDLAKLNASLELNLHAIRTGGWLPGKGSEAQSVPSTPNHTRFKSQFHDFLKQHSLSRKKIEILTGLVYLNMAGLHRAPLSHLLIDRGRLQLDRALKVE